MPLLRSLFKDLSVFKPLAPPFSSWYSNAPILFRLSWSSAFLEDAYLNLDSTSFFGCLDSLCFFAFLVDLTISLMLLSSLSSIYIEVWGLLINFWFFEEGLCFERFLDFFLCSSGTTTSDLWDFLPLPFEASSIDFLPLAAVFSSKFTLLFAPDFCFFWFTIDESD